MTYPLFSLEGRLALITGSAAGIGYALAKGMAEHGASVVVNARSADKVEAAVEALAAAGPHGPRRGLRRHRLRVGRGRSRAHRERHRADRHPGQQCRHPASRAARRISRRTSGSCCCRPTSPASFMSARRSARNMIARGARQDHQHRLGAERTGAAEDRALHRHQGCGAQPDQGHVHRLGQARAADQRHRAGLFPHPAQQGAGRGPEIHAPGWSSARRPGAGARSTNWSAPRSSWPPTRRPSSTATRSMSTAA